MSDFVLIIPVFNRANYLADTFLELNIFFKEKSNLLEQIIFVDDGSTDSTKEKMKFLSKKYDHLPVKILSYKQNRGKGFAILYALKNTNFQSIFFGFTDVDLPYDLHNLDKVKEKFKYYDIIVGNRLLSNQARTQYSFYRYLFSRVFRLLLPAQIRKYKDTQCGFKFFKKDIILHLFSKIITYNWIFDVELFLIAEKNNYKIFEIPVSLHANRKQNKGGVSFWKHSFTILNDLCKIYFNLKKGKYN